MLSCPIPLNEYPVVTLAHGGGGRFTNDLIDKLFAAAFSNPQLDARHDGAILDTDGKQLAFSTDSHVVSPLFFPGGDIGKLAINGTVNDLAMCGSKPAYLSVGFILEEGFPMEMLWKIVQSMKEAAEEAQVRIVTGDTKVVDKGKCDGVYINTSGVGVIQSSRPLSPSLIEPGDAILLSGDVGRHGIAIMAVREGLSFDTELESDCASLARMTQTLIDSGLSIHCMRDLTRGGMATALIELSEAASQTIELSEDRIPICPEVRGASEILGLDPLYVANEGRCVVILPESEADKALSIMSEFEIGRTSCRIGKIGTTSDQPIVVSKTAFGTRRVLSMLSGEQLPRIC